MAGSPGKPKCFLGVPFGEYAWRPSDELNLFPLICAMSCSLHSPEMKRSGIPLSKTCGGSLCCPRAVGAHRLGRNDPPYGVISQRGESPVSRFGRPSEGALGADLQNGFDTIYARRDESVRPRRPIE